MPCVFIGNLNVEVKSEGSYRSVLIGNHAYLNHLVPFSDACSAHLDFIHLFYNSSNISPIDSPVVQE